MNEKLALVITIGFVGDSLSSGLSVDFLNPFNWFNEQTHHGFENYGFIDAFDEKKQDFLATVNEALSATHYLKHFIPKIIIRFQSTSRPGINLAHYNPEINPETVPEQLYGPLYIRSQASNFQLDTAIIALGTNDAQDYNAMTVEFFLNLLDDAEYQKVINNLTIVMPEKAVEITKLTITDPTRKTTLISKLFITAKENQKLLRFLKTCELNSDSAINFLKEWEQKKYWNKTPEEINLELQGICNYYQNAQHTDQRAYPFTMAFILPPLFENRNPTYPSFHTLSQNVKEIRNQIRDFAEINGFRCYDYNEICKQLASENLEGFGPDNIHLNARFYSKLLSEFPFTDIFINIFTQRAKTLLIQSKQHNHDQFTIDSAEKELALLISQLKWVANKSKANTVSAKDFKNLFINVGDEHKKKDVDSNFSQPDSLDIKTTYN